MKTKKISLIDFLKKTDMNTESEEEIRNNIRKNLIIEIKNEIEAKKTKTRRSAGTFKYDFVYNEIISILNLNLK